MRIALVHDWLIHRGGAERVLLRLHALWPLAPIYTLAARPDFVSRWLSDAFIRTAWPGRLPSAWRFLPVFTPFLPSAIESFDLSQFDTVISSSVLFSKGIVTRTNTRHVSYCYSPSRMLWDRNAEYERNGPFSRALRHGLRLWDFQAAQRPDNMIAISGEVRQRIKKYYRRDAGIIHPPIDMPISDAVDGNYYLVVGRLMPHKNLPMVIEAFSRLGRPLIIAGSGPLYRNLKQNAAANIRFITDADDTELSRLYAGCRALIVPNEEDFGMTPVEALMHGKPVLALRGGGVMDIMVEGDTGEFFDEPIAIALADGVLRLERGTYDPVIMKRAAEPFRAERFNREMRAIVEQT